MRCNAPLDCTSRLCGRDHLMHFGLARAKSCLWWAARLRTAGKRATARLLSREHLPSSRSCTGACGHPHPGTPGCLLDCPSPLGASRRSPSFQAVAKSLLLTSFLMQSGEHVIAGPGDVSKASNPEGKPSPEYFIFTTAFTA